MAIATSEVPCPASSKKTLWVVLGSMTLAGCALPGFAAVLRAHSRDVTIALLLGAVVLIDAYARSQMIPAILLEVGYGDVWFEADLPRVYLDLTWRESPIDRAEVHPLFRLFIAPIVFAVKNLLRVEAVTAVRLVVSATAAVWAGTMYALLRTIGCRRLDALLFSILAVVSAGGVFFFVVPETFLFGSLTMLLALMLVPCGLRRSLGVHWYVAANVLTFAMTTSNWIVGVAVTAARHGARATTHVVVRSLALATLLWGIQKMVFPATTFFMDIAAESRQFLRADLGGPWHVLRSFFFHSLIMPAIQTFPELHRPGWPMMHTQPSAIGSGTPWGVVASGMWAVVLMISVLGFGRQARQSALPGVIAAALIGQLALHLVYGSETFLYSLHFVALLIPFTALGALGRFRPAVILLVLLLTPCVWINNSAQWQAALKYLVERS